MDVYTKMNGCDSIATLNLIVLSPNVVGTSLILCSNEIPYTWNGQSLTNTGTYTLSYLDINGCDSFSVMNLTVNPIPTPIITLSGNDLTTTQPFTTCQRFLNNNLIVGATASIYTPIYNGDYRVKVIDYNGCTDTSAGFALSSLGIDDNPLQHQLQIIPNPDRDRIFISSA